MARRLHASHLRSGLVRLDADQAHHARRVLRLPEGEPVEVFDDDGNCGAGALQYEGATGASVLVNEVIDSSRDREAAAGIRISVAAAVPKGDRADWMVQKLSELGVVEFIPLITERSVVVPGGQNKLARWSRIAIEAAKQSRRSGSMRIGELVSLRDALAHRAGERGWFLATEVDALPIREAVEQCRGAVSLTAYIGPEGGWSAGEMELFAGARVTPVRLTESILRVETAAIATAAIAATCV